jgi:hypothetical protein
LIISAPYLVFALFLLWLPRPWLRAGVRILPSHHRHLSPIEASNPHNLRRPGDRSIWLREELAKERNYIDLLRGSIGGWWVMNRCFAVVPATGAPSSAHLTLLAIQSGIFVVAVLLQTIRWNGRLSLFAPVFFLMGLMAGVCSWQVTLFAAVLVLALNGALPNPETFLLVEAIAVAAFSALFHRTLPLKTLLGASLILLPVMVSLLAQEKLMMKTRRPGPTEGGHVA